MRNWILLLFLAPGTGLEPVTHRLTGDCSAIELAGNALLLSPFYHRFLSCQAWWGKVLPFLGGSGSIRTNSPYGAGITARRASPTAPRFHCLVLLATVSILSKNFSRVNHKEKNLLLGAGEWNRTTK